MRNSAVDHVILLHKLLNHFGVRGVPHDLLKSYLTNRFQRTTILNSTSNKLELSCDVPHGSCLGPLLFLLYVNDLPLTSKFHTTRFADDTLLMMSDHNLENLQKKVNEHMINIDRWFRKNKLLSAAWPSGSERRFYDGHDRNVNGSTLNLVSLLRPWIRCFTTIISAW